MLRPWIPTALAVALAGCIDIAQTEEGDELAETARTPVADHLAVETDVLDTVQLGYFNVTTTGGRVDGTSTTGVTWGTVYDTLSDGHCAYGQLENNTGIITVGEACGGTVAFNQGGWWRNVRVCRTGTWTCSAWRWIQ